MARPELDPGDYVVGDDVDLDEEVLTYHGQPALRVRRRAPGGRDSGVHPAGQPSLSQIRRDRDAARQGELFTDSIALSYVCLRFR